MDWLKITDTGEIEFVTDEVKLVPEVKALLAKSYDKKGRAKQELMYLFLAYSYKSPYKDYSEHERLQQAKTDCQFPNDWEESTQVKLLIPKFKQGTTNRASRLLGTVSKFLDKFELHLNSIDLNERTAAGAIVHSPKGIMDTLRQLPGMAETLTELERQARTDIVKKISSKGDHELGWITKQNTVIKREEDDTDIQSQGEDS